MSESSATSRERLNRFLSRSGIGSRRKADDLIAAGRIALNGIPVERPGVLVDPLADRVTIDGRRVTPAINDTVWIVLYKPAGTLTTRRDQRGRPVVFDLLPRKYSQLIPVGRLDQDVTGVLLLTSDGHAANRLMHPRYGVSRSYEATVIGRPGSAILRMLGRGIDLGDPTPAHADVSILAPVRDGTRLRVEIREGRKREVKRMLAAVGHRVLSLHRHSYAGITLGRLRPGQWRFCSKTELRRLTDLISETGPETAMTAGSP
ncbi:MAG TPA: pseudouridine synthase [candidate division Zixibacteria bacterium]|jgi:pseudouridine synthase